MISDFGAESATLTPVIAIAVPISRTATAPGASSTTTTVSFATIAAAGV